MLNEVSFFGQQQSQWRVGFNQVSHTHTHTNRHKHIIGILDSIRTIFFLLKFYFQLQLRRDQCDQIERLIKYSRIQDFIFGLIHLLTLSCVYLCVSHAQWKFRTIYHWETGRLFALFVLFSLHSNDIFNIFLEEFDNNDNENFLWTYLCPKDRQLLTSSSLCLFILSFSYFLIQNFSVENCAFFTFFLFLIHFCPISFFSPFLLTDNLWTHHHKIG